MNNNTSVKNIIPIPTKSYSRSPVRSYSRSPTRSYSRSPTRSYSRSPTRSDSRSPTRSDSRSPVRNYSRSPTRNYSRSPARSDSRSPTRSDSRSPVRNYSRSPVRSYSRSPTRSYSKSSTRSYSRSPVRSYSRSPTRSYSEPPISNENKFKLYQPQAEYIFPVGLHSDIDINIIRNLDFDGVINLLTINKSASLRKLIYQNLKYIIKNSLRKVNIYYRNERIEKFAYKLLGLRELTLLKGLELSDSSMEELGYRLDVDNIQNNILFEDYVSLLNERQIINFTRQILPRLDVEFQYQHHSFELANDILDFALKIKNSVMIDTIKNWMNEYHLRDLTLQLNEFIDKFDEFY